MGDESLAFPENPCHAPIAEIAIGIVEAAVLAGNQKIGRIEIPNPLIKPQTEGKIKSISTGTQGNRK